MTTRSSALVLLVLVGCGRDHEPPSRDREVAARADLSHATQADLAAELAQADRRGTWADVRRRWEGQQLHWTVTRHWALCATATACNVAAFPVQRPAQQGWLPELSFAPGEFAKLTAACGDAASCALDVEGTLTRLEVSGDLPTSVHFDHVRVVGARKS